MASLSTCLFKSILILAELFDRLIAIYFVSYDTWIMDKHKDFVCKQMINYRNPNQKEKSKAMLQAYCLELNQHAYYGFPPSVIWLLLLDKHHIPPFKNVLCLVWCSHAWFLIRFQRLKWSCIDFNISAVKSYPPGQNCLHFTNDMFRWIFMNEKFCILIKIPLKFVPKGTIYNNPVLVWIMAWCRIGSKPLYEPMLTPFTDAYMQH